MPKRSLYWWFLKWLLLVVLLLALLQLLLLRHLVSTQRLAHAQDTLALQATMVRDLLQERFSDGATEATLQQHCLHMRQLTDAQVALLTQDGTVIADSSGRATARLKLASRQDVRQALQGAAGSWSEPIGSGFQTVHAAVPLNASNVAVVRLSRPVQVSGDLLPLLLHRAMLPAAVVFLLVAILGLVMRRRIIALLQAHADLLARFGKGETTLRSSLSPCAESGILAEAFDGMAQRLEEQLRGLRFEKQQWVALFTGMREGIVAVDSDLNMIALNQAARLFLGLAADEAVEGKPIFTVVRNASLNQFIKELLADQRSHLERQLDVRSETGQLAAYRFSGVRFDFEPNARQGALVVMHDVTRVRRLEEMRKEFVANVSHELKTPITVIKGFTETLEMCMERSPEQAMQFVHIIAQQTERLNAIIDDLLTLSRLEQSERRITSDFEVHDLRTTVASAVRLCASKIAQRHLRIEESLLSFPLLANHRLLEQAITNLIDNAVKYSPEAGVIQVSMVKRAHHVLVIVRDHGPGIPREHHERIFERFHRVDTSRDRQTGGTGLGLSIVKHIMHAHGGSVQVESQLGEGAAFTLRLPARPAETP